jgi:transposase-like protein
MPRGYPSLTPEQKREITTRIKERGERVADLAKEYGVSPRIIYGYLSRSGQQSGTLLELSKLKREKEALLKIVGQLIVDQKLGKKIQRRYGN